MGVSLHGYRIFHLPVQLKFPALREEERNAEICMSKCKAKGKHLRESRE